jgi:hypothetical protein
LRMPMPVSGRACVCTVDMNERSKAGRRGRGSDDGPNLLPERSGPHHRERIAVGRSDDARIGLPNCGVGAGFVATNSADLLAFDERQQVRVDRVGVRRRHAMR